MWEYEKRLQFPVRIKNPDARAAKIIISQYGGPDGELGASLRYLSQRFSMPYARVSGLLTDIGTEELAHLEMIGAIVSQLTRNLTIDEIKAQGFDGDVIHRRKHPYLIERTARLFPAGLVFPLHLHSLTPI